MINEDVADVDDGADVGAVVDVPDVVDVAVILPPALVVVAKLQPWVQVSGDEQHDDKASCAYNNVLSSGLTLTSLCQAQLQRIEKRFLLS